MDNSGFKSFRRKTREVLVGGVGIGGKNPIRIQSMTTSLTSDIEATTEQIMKLADFGCELARVTVQGKKEAAACEHIKNLLLKKGYSIPVIADIHFYPPAAMEVLEFVDKVRINPGNFLDKRASFKTFHYDSLEAYQQELVRIEEGFAPLVIKCLQQKKALRIGVNHGSLSDRIMSRYGDNPEGMVQSALEYAQVAIKYGFYDLIFSMKSSNPLIMIQAYRLLCDRMDKLSYNFPLHLGVTEAGLAEDGRIKSAVGIGTLLLDGIGDTIRVSLTEDPWMEIAPAKRIVRVFEDYKALFSNKRPLDIQPHQHENASETIVIAHITLQDIEKPSFFDDIGLEYKFDHYTKGPKAPQAVFLKSESLTPENQDKLELLKQLSIRCYVEEDTNIKFIDLEHFPKNAWPELLQRKKEFFIIKYSQNAFFVLRELQRFLKENNSTTPLIIFYAYPAKAQDVLIQTSLDIGSALVDNIAQGVMLCCQDFLKNTTDLLLNILQACRKRLFKTDYIACPGCGRTLFNLQEVTQLIKSKTAHLAGVKIAVMGCIVNGPGEMADADFGYVGSKAGHVDLYIGKNCIEKNIPSHLACDRLIALIKSQKKWIEPPA